MAVGGNANAKRIALLLWLLVAFFYFYLSYDYIRVTTNDGPFGQYAQYVVQIAGNGRRPPKQIRDPLLVRAEERSLPIRGEQIKVTGRGDALVVDVSYDVDNQMPGLLRALYTRAFEHHV